MSLEQKPIGSASIEGPELHFEKVSKRENTISYIFKNVVVTIDSSGKNYEPLPEIVFGTYDEIPAETSLNKPEQKREGVDMAYVSRCIQEVVKDSGIHKFWIYPFGDDNPDDQESRKQARLRIFGRYMQLTPDEKNYGYIVDIP